MKIGTLSDFCSNKGISCIAEEKMSKHTSFKTGGNADLFITVSSSEALSAVICKADELSVPYFIIGNGTDLLVSDEGIEGAVISLGDMNAVTVENCTVTAQAGASLSAVCLAAQTAGLSGLEFAFGIPGSVGGALYMNAGAYGGEMKDAVFSAEYISPSGEQGSVVKENMALGYRESVFKANGNIITSVKFELHKGDPKEIRSAMDSFMRKRREKQPLEYPSAGSVFKRPEGHFAGALIEQSGLKGTRVGGAMVSEKHAGFIINYDNATSDDIKNLIESVRKTVFEKFGVTLEPEIIFKGRNLVGQDR